MQYCVSPNRNTSCNQYTTPPCDPESINWVPHRVNRNLLAHQGKQPCFVFLHFLYLNFVRSIENISWNGMEWGREVLLPANPDLADILGLTWIWILTIPIFEILLDSEFLDFQVSRFPEFAICLPCGGVPCPVDYTSLSRHCHMNVHACQVHFGSISLPNFYCSPTQGG